MVVILAAFGRPGPVWAVVYFVIGFAGGAYFRRIDTSRRFGARELQLEFYTAQDERRLPDRIHPPWWHEHIIAERNRLRKQQLQGWVIALFGLWAAAMLVAQASIAGFRLVPTGILVLYLLLCAGYVTWYRLMRPSLLADLDELARQGRSRGYRIG
ncbi:hypothetical protein [Nocardia sp. NPDC056000]|uniref:hypothetical protein n=1 Tax=Nocardia sp. NPDC056000 TaxID=3345674 RepID=UPI0035E03C83